MQIHHFKRYKIPKKKLFPQNCVQGFNMNPVTTPIKNSRNCPISCLQAALNCVKIMAIFKAQFRLNVCFVKGRLKILICSFLKISPISLIKSIFRAVVVSSSKTVRLNIFSKCWKSLKFRKSHPVFIKYFTPPPF